MECLYVRHNAAFWMTPTIRYLTVPMRSRHARDSAGKMHATIKQLHSVLN